MSELKSCAGLVNSSELYARNRGCSLEFTSPSATLDCEAREVKDEGINVVVAEISAELQRERQRNAELMERISLLEAQIQEREKESLLTDRQDGCPIATDRNVKKFKRQKIEPRNDEFGEAGIAKIVEMSTQIKLDTTCMAPKYANQEDCMVNWMSMDDAQLLHLEKFKDRDLDADCEETDDSDDGDDEFIDEDDTDIDYKNRENDGNLQVVETLKGFLHQEGLNGGEHIQVLETPHGSQTESTVENVNQRTNVYHERGSSLPIIRFTNNKTEPNKHSRKEIKKIRGCKVSSEIHTSGREIVHKRSGTISSHKKPPKVAFCPKEVKRIMESEALLLKNAQSHTIRKIIVFASLGIRHGCEEMYELDFNHFSILRKGEPYVSPTDPGEHVLYENPGVQRKVFYPNRQNLTLCPVQILQEEKAMRPSDPSCPSCLFLCIKYGGRTRNLPQNEYVRQRMGRNKLKSFGPLICQMAMLVHIRSGSFFFKALGITLLFMAGFPDDLVQRETKYRNLDLLQKYYRTDEDAEGEELFHLYPVIYETKATSTSQQLSGKAISTKSSGNKQTTSISKPQNLSRSSNVQQTVPSSSVPPTQFGLMGFTSIHSHAMATPSYPMFPPHPANTFMSMAYWPPSNAFPSCPYPSSYGYRSFPPRNYVSLHPQPYYGHPSCNTFMPKKDAAMEEVSSDSDSSSSSTEPKKAEPSCK